MTLPRILDFDFQDLPLVTDLGVGAGLIEGRASINVWGFNDWSVSGISLVGYRDNKPVYVSITNDEHGQIYRAVYDQLENGEFKKQIEGQIERDLREAA